LNDGEDEGKRKIKRQMEEEPTPKREINMARRQEDTHKTL